MTAEVINEIGAKIGDRIMLAVETASLLKATFLLYVFPILCMLAGSVLGAVLAVPLGLGRHGGAGAGLLPVSGACGGFCQDPGQPAGQPAMLPPEDSSHPASWGDV